MPRRLRRCVTVRPLLHRGQMAGGLVVAVEEDDHQYVYEGCEGHRKEHPEVIQPEAQVAILVIDPTLGIVSIRPPSLNRGGIAYPCVGSDVVAPSIAAVPRAQNTAHGHGESEHPYENRRGIYGPPGCFITSYDDQVCIDA
jgi:hypothetical protein